MLLSAITVMNDLDAGAGSLRDAVDLANTNPGPDSISFDPLFFSTHGTITLTSGSLLLKDVAETSFLAPTLPLTISGNHTTSLFVVNAGATASIDSLTLTGGLSNKGGAVNANGTLTMVNCVIDGNAATLRGGGGLFVGNTGSLTLRNSRLTNNTSQSNGGGLFVAFSGVASLSNCTISGNASLGANFGGGGIYSQGTTTLDNCAISGNSAVKNGGGTYVAYGTTTMTNVTVSGNTAAASGGGIEVYAGTLGLTNVTISGNSATGSGVGAGLWNAASPNVTINNTIVAGNTDTGGASDLGGLSVSVSGFCNLIGLGGSGGFVNGVNGNQVGVANALLTPLANYGGPTQTMALLPGSPAIDTGTTNGAPSTDQRGLGRVGLTDIGAFESQGFTLATVAGSTPQSTIVTTPFTNPLAVTVTANNPAEPVNGGVIGFTAPSSGASAVLSGNPATISGGQASVTATANNVIGVYVVTAIASGIATPASWNLNNLEVPSLIVDTTSDVVDPLDGLTSLREAVTYANTFTSTAPTVTFDPIVFALPQTITLTNGQLELSNTLVHETISGPAAAVTISGNSASRVFQIDASVITTLNALTITGGFASQGGAVIDHGTLTLTYCVVNGNTALTEGGGVYVGGGGVLTVDHSTLSNNQTQNNGGGLFVAASGTASLTNCIVSGNSTQSTSGGYGGGGVYSRGTTSLANSTVSGNTAAKRGGGVYVSYGTTTLTNVTVSGNSANYGGGLEFYQGTVTLTNVTISGNSATASGGGVWNQNSVNSTFKNTIVAGNTKTSGASDLEGRPVSGTYNLIGTGGSGGLVNGVGNNQVGVANALLAPLANYGGPTQTMALLPGSLAIDTGTSTGAPGTDQRGLGRVGLTDIGAFESQGFTLATVAGSTPQSTIVTTPFTNPLVVTVTANNPAEPVNGGVINFNVPLIGASATLSSSSSSINTSQASVIATANGLAGSYDVTAATRGAASFNFSLTNIAQVVLSGLGNVVTYTQGGSPVAVAPTIVVTGNLGQNIASATIVFSNVQLGDRFSFDNQFALQHTYVEDIPNQTATLTLTGVDTPANYQTTLRSILVWNVASIPSTALRIATFTAFDVFANSGSGTQTIAVTLVSQPPQLFNIEATPINYVANYPSFPPQPISATLQVTDPDSDNLTSAIVQVTSGYQNDLNSHDLLTFTARFGISGLFDAVTGTLTLSGISSVSNYRAAIQSITFSTSGPGTTGTTRTLSITAYDDTLPTPLASNTVTRNVSLTLSVAPPTLSGLGGTTTFVQLGNKVPIANSLVVTQPNRLNLASATVNLTNLKPGDRFEFSNSFALQHSFVLSGDQTSAVLTITGYTSAANYQTTLRSVTYWNVAGEPDYTPRTATFTIFDPTGQSDSGVQNFKVAPANQPPVLFGIESTPLVYLANHPEFPPQPISDTIAVSDPDSNTLTRATVQVTAGYQNDVNGHDLLSFVDRFGITSTFDPLTGTLTLAGSSSVSNYRVALRSVLFSASGSAISGATRTLSIVAYDATIPIPLSSNTVTRDVNVITTNVSPVLSGLAGTANYLKGAPPLLIAPTLQVEDADSTVLFGATISFTNWQGGDRLDFWNQFALQHTFTEDLVTHTASLTLSGKSSIANYQIQLQSLGFYCLAGNPVLSARRLSIVVNDGYSNSNTVTGDITVST